MATAKTTEKTEVKKEQEQQESNIPTKATKPDKTAIPPEPGLICIGSINGVSDITISEKGYCMNNFSINGLQGSMSGSKLWMWLPAFFMPNFNPTSFFKENTQFSDFIYYSNIISHKNSPPTVMEAICGGYENPLFDYLWDKMATLCGPEWSDSEWENGNFLVKVNETLKEFISDNDNLVVGYTMVQRRDRETKEIVQGWNVDRLFIPNEENMKFWLSNKRYRVGFDAENGVPF